ncbi:tetratricopeptide repeat protein [candidate division GN15 bacterium]|nr:tetratricopeptide repeat protein [candidate division GN15 bacterium]
MSSSASTGRFDYRRTLGRGGTADVSLAWDAQLNRLVALKQPREDDNDSLNQFRQLAEREYDLLHGQRFPGFIRVLDADTSETPYLVMEYCEGITLDACRKGIPLERKLNLLSAVAVSLHFLHAVRIVHGDLKPQNVFLPRDLSPADDGRLFWAKLSDLAFGRRLDEPESTRIGVGTVGYMAPEQIDGQTSSVRSDLFALGVLAYQFLAGWHPYLKDEDDPVKVNAAIREEDAPLLNSVEMNIPESIAELVANLMARSDHDRPVSAWAVCEHLEKIGATYPFRRAFQPGYFVHREAHFRQAVHNVPGLAEAENEDLVWLAQNDVSALRMLLSANLSRGHLNYDGARFQLAGRAYWPCRLRRTTLARFSNAPLGRKRQLIKAASVGTTEDAITLGVLPDRQRESPIDPQLTLLRSVLTPSTIRRVSTRLALYAEQADQLSIAANLWIQAGDLVAAERCTHQAAAQLQNEQRPSEALRLLRRLRRVAELSGDLFDIRQCLLLEGLIHHEAGRLDQAEAAYDRVVTSYEDHDEDIILGKAYKCLGDLCKARQKFDDGVEILHKALELHKRLGQDLELSHTLNNLGNIYWIATDYTNALDYYRQALSMQRRLDATFEVASTLNNIGSIYVVSGRYRRAERIFNLSLQFKKEIGHLGEMARTLNNLGYTYYLWGRQHKAVDALTESLEINRRIGSQKELLFNLENLATLMIVAGQMKEALYRLKEGLDLARSLGDMPHVGVFNNLMSTVLRRSGRFDAALNCLDDVAKVLGEIDDNRLRIVERNGRAWCHYQLGDYDSALSYNSEALELALSINDKGEQLQAYMLRVRLESDEKNRAAALQLAGELGLGREKQIMHYCLIDQWLKSETPATEDVQALVRECSQGLDQMQEDIEFAWMNIVLAEYHLRQGEEQVVAQYLNRAHSAATQRGLLPETMTALILTGKLQRSQGAYEDAFDRYRQALDIAKQMASGISDDQLRSGFMNKRTVRFLADEIKSLSARMSQKERAGA